MLILLEIIAHVTVKYYDLTTQPIHTHTEHMYEYTLHCISTFTPSLPHTSYSTYTHISTQLYLILDIHIGLCFYQCSHTLMAPISGSIYQSSKSILHDTHTPQYEPPTEQRPPPTPYYTHACTTLLYYEHTMYYMQARITVHTTI